MSPEDARRFRDRWSMVARREQAELERQPVLLKLRQIAALMASVDVMGWRAGLDEGDEAVRQRWQTLRRRLGVCQ